MKFMIQAFPGGRPGWALFLFRASGGILLTYMAVGVVGTSYMLSALLGLLVVAQLLGIQTRLVAVSALLLAIVATSIACCSQLPLLIASTLNAAAITLVGPGAISLDAVRFGHRTSPIKSSKTPEA